MRLVDADAISLKAYRQQLGIADRVGILMGGELISLGPPAELSQPRDPRVADFLNPKIDLKNPRFKQLE